MPAGEATAPDEAAAQAWFGRITSELAPIGQTIADLRRRVSTAGPSVA